MFEVFALDTYAFYLESKKSLSHPLTPQLYRLPLQQYPQHHNVSSLQYCRQSYDKKRTGEPHHA